MTLKPLPLALAALFFSPAVYAVDETLSELTITAPATPAVTANNPSPAAQVTQAQMREINVINVEDALKYTPSLFVRKRYVGDTNGIIATRTTGSVSSASSLVYADGLLLSNLLGNSFGFPPRWNIVGAEEIETIDVLHGPFSAVLPGNSTGATVLMTTRTPEKFEAHARVQGFVQPSFKEYGTDDSFGGHQEQLQAGDRKGRFAWSFLANHLDSRSQPINFATSTLTAPSGAGTPVTGAVPFNSATNVPSVNFGATSLDQVVQDTVKARLTWDFSRDTRAAVTLARFRNDSLNDTRTYLRDAMGNPVWNDSVNIDGRNYNLTNASVPRLAPTDSNTENTLFGVSLTSKLSPTWRIELAASDYRTPVDVSRTPTTGAPGVQPGSTGGAGRISFGDDTGWRNFDARAIWKPSGGEHTVTFGYHFDRYHIESSQFNATDWRDASSVTSLRNAFEGDTRTDALYVQDVWKLAPRWTATVGVRQERWQALDGERSSDTEFNPPTGAPVTEFSYEDRSENYTSPKFSLAWQATPDWQLRGSVARAYRLPTVSELFQTETRGNGTFISDPNLAPEKILATDLTAEGLVAQGNLRLSLFDTRTDDALYSQLDVPTNISRVQNIERIRVTGFEAVYDRQNWGVQGLDFSGSVTYADSEIMKNGGSPDTVGNEVPRIPEWRLSALMSYRYDEHWSGSVGVRHASEQFGRLDNTDTNSEDTGGVGAFTTVDLRVGYRINKLFRASFGIDNVTNDKYFIGPHPFPQRTYHAELRFDL